MRHPLIVLLLLLFASYGMAQGQTPPREGGGGGHFGALVVKYAVIRDQGAIMIGGRGGWNVTPSLVFGGGAYGSINGVDAPEGAVPDAPGRLDIKFQSFGFDLEYSPHPAAVTHLTLDAFFGAAANHYVRHGTDEQHGETDFMLLFEPSLGVERRVADWLHLNLAVSYRLVTEVEQPGLKAADFNGAAVALAVKLGQF
jgi:hypothetical protein